MGIATAAGNFGCGLLKVRDWTLQLSWFNSPFVCAIPKVLKMALVASWLGTQYYGHRIEVFQMRLSNGASHWEH